MRFRAAIEGNLEEFMAAELTVQRRAITRTMKQASEQVKEGWRAQIRRAGLSPKLANTVRTELYPRGRQSRGAAGLVFVRAGKNGAMGSAVAALKNLSEGALITPKGGKPYLAIPTGYNLRSGQRQAGRTGRVIVTPEMMVRDRGMTFTIPVANGAKLWCIRLTKGEYRTAQGKAKTRYFRGNFHDSQLLGSGRRQRLESGRSRTSIAKQGWAPMFVLIPRAIIPQRLDLDGVVTRMGADLPRLLLQNLEAEG